MLINNFGSIKITPPKLDNKVKQILQADIISIRFGKKSSFVITAILSGPTPEIEDASYFITDETNKKIFTKKLGNTLSIPKMISGDSVILSLEYKI